MRLTRPAWLRRPPPGGLPHVRRVRGRVRAIGKEVCLFASISADGRVKPYVRYHLQELGRQGIRTVLILNVGGTARPSRFLRGPWHSLIVRANRGFDFGAWADTLQLHPDLWSAKRILLVNDSIFGPVQPLAPILEAIRASEADLLGLTESYQVTPHYQSYFLVLQHEALRSDAIRAFWAEVEPLRAKRDVIAAFELALYSRAIEAGLRCEALLPYQGPLDEPVNPTLAGWSDLLDRGSPYLKIQLLSENPTGADLTGWRSRVADPHLLELMDAELDRRRATAPAAQVRPAPQTGGTTSDPS